MDSHRLVNPNSLEVFDFGSSFSSFDFVDNYFPGNPGTLYSGIRSARRIFSLARSFEAKTLVVENINPNGIVQEEVEDIATLYPDYIPGEVKRLSFFRKPFDSSRDIAEIGNSDLIGYAILKQDTVPSEPDLPRWHIFESVFPKYEHKHNCVPNLKSYNVSIGDTKFAVQGLMYCQQNGLNKACAQVALRSLLSRLLPGDDIGYRQLNSLAQSHNPADGLTPQQMRAVLNGVGVEFNDIDYEEEERHNSAVRADVPFQNFLYSVIEAGCGGLLGFSMSGPQATPSRHIIPFFGHTFNKDTWAPDADVAYFNIGGGVGYVPSSSWTSSFIGHDDNFGPNFCVPRLYVRPKQVQYVVELRKNGVQYGGLIAEAQALQYLYSICKYLNNENAWSRRLTYYADPHIQRVILRTVCIKRSIYLQHLAVLEDGTGNKENPELPRRLESFLPDTIWMVEVSIPQLFPANERKIGEILLNAAKERDVSKNCASKIDFSLFLMARMPAEYFFLSEANQREPSFARIPSKLTSHVPLMRM